MKLVHYSPQAANIHERLEDIGREFSDCDIIVLNGTRDSLHAEDREVFLPLHMAIRTCPVKGGFVTKVCGVTFLYPLAFPKTAVRAILYIEKQLQARVVGLRINTYHLDYCFFAC